ncbi:hypothetical protein FRC09_006260 [Ceratobasidium sp. 395]|nr:hypothetical protein FRC09_006260 [Ceratobasidium sp. 395]
MSMSTLKSTPKSTLESTPESTFESTLKNSGVGFNETDSRDNMSLDSARSDIDGANDAQEDPKYSTSPTPVPQEGISETESEQDRKANTAIWVATLKLRNKIADLHNDIDNLYEEIADLQEVYANQRANSESTSDSELEVDRLIDVEMSSETSCSEEEHDDKVKNEVDENGQLLEPSDPNHVMRRMSEWSRDEENEGEGDEEDEDEDEEEEDEKEEDKDDKNDKDNKDDKDDKDEGEENENDEVKSDEGEGEGEGEEYNKVEKGEFNEDRQLPEYLDLDVVMRRPSECQPNEEEKEEEEEEGEVKEEEGAKDKGKVKEKYEDKDKEEGELDEDDEDEDEDEVTEEGDEKKGNENRQSPESFDFDIVMRRRSEIYSSGSLTPKSFNNPQELTTLDYTQDDSSSDCLMLSASPTQSTFTFATSYMRSRHSPARARSYRETPIHHLSSSSRYRPYERRRAPGEWGGDRYGYMTCMFLPTPFMYLARDGGIWSYSCTPPMSSCANRRVGDIHFTPDEVEGQRLYWVCCNMDTDSGRGWVSWELGEAHPLCSGLVLHHFSIDEPPLWI